jgi:hypothetical protein
MWSWFTFFLIGHILAAIAAFGPTFAFPLIAAHARKDPAHGAFGIHIIHEIERRMTLPAAAVVALFGVGLIITAHVDLLHSEWLLIAIAIYIAAYTFAATAQLKNSAKLLDILRAMPPGPPPEDAGPPPEVMALGKKLQFGGMYLTISIVSILVLMVWRPGAAFN